MQKRILKSDGTPVSLLGMGAMRLPTVNNQAANIDKEAAFAMFDYAYANGVNYFDTAYPYHMGQSEIITGKALSRYPRESWLLANKLPGWLLQEVGDAERIFNEQLEKCGVEYFDFYLCHNIQKRDLTKYPEFKVMEFLSRMKAEGKIRRLGFSFHEDIEFLEKVCSYYDWDFGQLQLNYLDWELQDAKTQYAILEKYNIPCIVMEPVRGGALADLCPEANAIFKNAAPDKSIASWAMRYAADFPNVLTVLSGASDMEQMQDNIRTMSSFAPLSKAERKTIAAALAVFKEKFSLPCTACRYCMDCPAGIDIPAMLAIYNQYLLSKNGWEYHACYSGFPEGARARNCTACGICMEHCPQSIDIPEQMRRITAETNKLFKQFTRRRGGDI